MVQWNTHTEIVARGWKWLVRMPADADWTNCIDPGFRLCPHHHYTEEDIEWFVQNDYYNSADEFPAFKAKIHQVCRVACHQHSRNKNLGRPQVLQASCYANAKKHLYGHCCKYSKMGVLWMMGAFMSWKAAGSPSQPKPSDFKGLNAEMTPTCSAPAKQSIEPRRPPTVVPRSQAPTHSNTNNATTNININDNSNNYDYDNDGDSNVMDLSAADKQLPQHIRHKKKQSRVSGCREEQHRRNIADTDDEDSDSMYDYGTGNGTGIINEPDKNNIINGVYYNHVIRAVPFGAECFVRANVVNRYCYIRFSLCHTHL